MKNMELTIREVFDIYFKKKNIRPATLASEKNVIISKFMEPILDMKVNDITQEYLRAWVDSLIEENLKANTICNYFGVLKRAVQFTFDVEIKCKMPARIKNNDKRDELTEDRFTKILLRCDDTLMKAVLLSYYANMNNHEVANLKYRDVYYDNNAICLHSVIKCENGVWHHYEDGAQDQNMRFALISKQVMEYVGRGEPDQKVVNHASQYIGNKFTIVCNYLGINLSFKNLKTKSLYKKININPIGIIENQHLFCFEENKDHYVVDCINEFISEGGRKDKNIKWSLYFESLKGVKLCELTKDILISWGDELCKNYFDNTIHRAYSLLKDVLFKYSGGMFHLDKYRLELKSQKEKTVKVNNRIVNFDKTKVRNMFDGAYPDLKKAFLLSGYGGFQLSEIVQINVKDIDKQACTVSFNKKTAILNKAMVRFLGRGEPEDNVIKTKTGTLSFELKKLCEKYDTKIDFVQIRGAYIDDNN